MHVLNLYGISNAFVTYIGSTFEFIIFTGIFIHASSWNYRPHWKIIRAIGFAGAFIPAITWLVFRTEFATAAFAVEYTYVISLCIYVFYQVAIGEADREYLPLTLVIIFYLLGSFPYLFAWEWLKTLDMQMLIALGWTHAAIHTLCYFIFTYLIWRSSLSFSAR